jgi:hypothetical protein
MARAQLAAFLGIATSIVLVVWMLWSMTADRRAIAHLPAHQRRVIFEHTLSGVRTMCIEQEDPVIRRPLSGSGGVPALVSGVRSGVPDDRRSAPA